MKKTSGRLSDAALLLSIIKEMTTPNRSKSVRVVEAKQTKKNPNPACSAGKTPD
jgi:hypothetical protein